LARIYVTISVDMCVVHSNASAIVTGIMYCRMHSCTVECIRQPVRYSCEIGVAISDDCTLPNIR